MATPQTGLRPLPNRLPGLVNFYMAGQWVTPGGGLPGGLMSARGHPREECERLIDLVWAGERARLWRLVKAEGCRRDDLRHAFAALWTARRTRHLTCQAARRLMNLGA